MTFLHSLLFMQVVFSHHLLVPVLERASFSPPSATLASLLLVAVRHSVQTKQVFLFRPNTNIRSSKLLEYSLFVRIFGFDRIFGILPNIRQLCRIFGQDLRHIGTKLGDFHLVFIRICQMLAKLIKYSAKYRIFGEIRIFVFGQFLKHLFRPNIRPNYSDEYSSET